MSTHHDDGTPTATRTPQVRAPRRRRWPVAAAAALLVAVLGLVLLLQRGDGEEPAGAGAGAAPSTVAPAGVSGTVPPPPPTPEPTGPTEDVDEPPPSLPQVPLDAPAAAGNGIVVTIPQLEAIEGSAVGPGNIAGPALRLTARIQNGTAAPVPLSGVAVNLSYGPDRTPASPLEDVSQRPFAGTVQPGQSADGVYVFTVPADARDAVTVEVGYQAGAPLLLFTGDAS
ncbi:hypothetical protein DQ238_18420 [Geodermatophilus sp. TF02-6]|uniref:hypothetical protein n=1 Tax=Geodermatophilus sp. TF02-6 TaxID=2250575 RepID=UPI000DE9AF56|nr:hypothetical protein [Geodermatophilus sp. TF02-6]RBY76005.1 hypothetical protein DQ238_18420 [Geodermatophilus sp. TF02-6]